MDGDHFLDITVHFNLIQQFTHCLQPWLLPILVVFLEGFHPQRLMCETVKICWGGHGYAMELYTLGMLELAARRLEHYAESSILFIVNINMYTMYGRFSCQGTSPCNFIVSKKGLSQPQHATARVAVGGFDSFMRVGSPRTTPHAHHLNSNILLTIDCMQFAKNTHRIWDTCSFSQSELNDYV